MHQLGSPSEGVAYFKFTLDELTNQFKRPIALCGKSHLMWKGFYERLFKLSLLLRSQPFLATWSELNLKSVQTGFLIAL